MGKHSTAEPSRRMVYSGMDGVQWNEDGVHIFTRIQYWLSLVTCNSVFKETVKIFSRVTNCISYVFLHN